VAMSEENVKLARKSIEYWNRGDLDALSDLGDEHGVPRLRNWRGPVAFRPA